MQGLGVWHHTKTVLALVELMRVQDRLKANKEVVVPTGACRGWWCGSIPHYPGVREVL